MILVHYTQVLVVLCGADIQTWLIEHSQQLEIIAPGAFSHETYVWRVNVCNST